MKSPIQEGHIVQSETRSRRRETSAFSLPELICVLAALALLTAVVVPALAQGKPRAEQAICFNNLRMVGQALLLFGADAGESTKTPPSPWRTQIYPQSPLANNAWYHAALLSNYLVSPKVFACPSDTLAKPASDFSLSADGGFLSSNHRNAALSYFWGLDSSALIPNSVLSGDRNIRYSGISSSCSSGISPAPAIYLNSASPTGWREGLHSPSGNILLYDGRVEQTTDLTVNRLFNSKADDNGSIHLLLPRP